MCGLKMNIIVTVLFSAASLGNTDGVDVACPGGPDSASLALRNKLFCNYDTNSRPVDYHTNVTHVKIHLIVQFFNFIVESNALNVHSWMICSWKDDHLKWNHSDFEGLKTLTVSSTEIWVPDVTVLNGGDMRQSSSGIVETLCNVDSDGSVTCVSPTVHSSHCDADLSQWPYDSHNCSVVVNSRTNRPNQLSLEPNLELSDKGIDILGDTSSNREWELLDAFAFLYKVEFLNETVPVFLMYNFVFKRHSGRHAATLLIPSLVLATMTLSIFWIQPHAAERMCLIWLNLLCHCLYLQYLGANLPSNGDKYPIILLFYRDSLVLVDGSLIITLLVRRVAAATSAPPGWITTITDAVLSTQLGQILMSGVDNKVVAENDDITPLVKPSSKDQRWQHFSVFLDRTIFLIYLITFLIFLCLNVP